MHAKHSICLCSMSSAEKALEEGVAPKWWLNMTELCSIPIFLIKPSSPTFSSPPLPFFSCKSQPPLMFGLQKSGFYRLAESTVSLRGLNGEVLAWGRHPLPAEAPSSWPTLTHLFRLILNTASSVSPSLIFLDKFWDGVGNTYIRIIMVIKTHISFTLRFLMVMPSQQLLRFSSNVASLLPLLA